MTDHPLTSAQKQSRRNSDLDAIAQAAGWLTWTRYATAVKRGVVSIERNPDTKQRRVMSDKSEYKAWASNDQGASTDVANNEPFTSQRAAEDAARREMGSGWTIHIMRDGNEIKRFRIR